MNLQRQFRHAAWVLPAIAMAQSPFSDDSRYEPTPIGVLGVVSLPTVFPVEGELKVRTPIPTRKNPDIKSPLVMMVKFPEDVQAREIRNDAQQALVFARVPGWYLVRTRFGKGWISEKNIGRFEALDNLLVNRQSFLTEEWDGRLWGSPSISSTFVMVNVPVPGRSQPSAKFLSFIWADGQLWLKVSLIKLPGCGDAAILEKDTEGWVPAYSPSGSLIIWFSPRGC